MYNAELAFALSIFATIVSAIALGGVWYQREIGLAAQLKAAEQPRIKIEHSKYFDAMDPNSHVSFQVIATNEGNVPILIEMVGIGSPGSQKFIGLWQSTAPSRGSVLQIPYELEPSRTVTFAVELVEVVKIFESNKSYFGDYCCIRCVTRTSGSFDGPPYETSLFLRWLKRDDSRNCSTPVP